MSATPTTAPPPRFGTDDDAPVQVRSAAREPFSRALSPADMLRTLWTFRDLVVQFARREIAGRTKGTRLGIVWTVLNPLLILAVNTLVFAVILRQRWDVLGGGPAEFPLTMLCGMTVFNIFGETVCAAPTMIVSRPNFVTRVVFPIEIFPVSALASALFYASINLVLILLGAGLLLKTFSTTVWLFPVVLVPLTAMTLGLSWVLAALGVFLRDINAIVSLVIYRVLVFVTPLFFPASSVPENFRPLLDYNPLTIIVENARRTLLWSQTPDWTGLAWVTAISLLLMQAGYACFLRGKRGFADVI